MTETQFLRAQRKIIKDFSDKGHEVEWILVHAGRLRAIQDKKSPLGVMSLRVLFLSF